MPDTPHYLIWLAAMVTLGIYTYLWSDNKLYRMLLNVMVGLGVGYNTFESSVAVGRFIRETFDAIEKELKEDVTPAKP